MFLTNLFNYKKECSHSKIANNVDSAYCPDCGKLIKNEWYITRCDCCGIKLHTTSRNGKIFPLNNYCTNCGSKDFHVEKLEKIDFININYAVLIKKELNEFEYSLAKTTQCWQEKNNEQPKLLMLYQ
jgi:hypothetical protein